VIAPPGIITSLSAGTIGTPSTTSPTGGRRT
jgi:hypothetical protein